jgi:hypothetical protein
MAMWVWPQSILEEEPHRMVSRLRDAHVDIIIPYVCGHRAVDHYSEATNTPAFYNERLHLIIEESHRAGLKVHACFDELNAYPAMPVYGLRQRRKDGSYGSILCPANPVVSDFVLERLRWTITEFDYDGINLEDGYIFNNYTIYDPAHQSGERFRVVPVCYCDYCKKHAPIEEPEWDAWKQERLTDLISKEAAVIHSLKPRMPFSVAARMPYDRNFYTPYKKDVPYYDDWKFCQSRDSFSADWAEWLRLRHINFACPMSYFHSPRMVEIETMECRHLIPDARLKIWMGLGLGEITARVEENPAAQNDARNVEILLREQLQMGQENVVFFCYQYMQDDHIPMLARFR